MKKLLTVFATIAAAFCCAFGISACGEDSVPDYKDFEKFKAEFAVECFNDGAVPQGLAEYYAPYEAVADYGKAATNFQGYFLVSAYMNDGSPSRIYVTGQNTGYVGYVTMLNEDGTPHKGSVNGIATNGSRLWVTDGDSILVAQASEECSNANILREIIAKAEKNSKLKEGEEVQTVQFTASFKANCNASFLYYFHDPRYTTASYDRLYVGGGRESTSVMYEYRTNTNATNVYGLDLIDSDNSDSLLSDNVPKIQKMYSIPENIQGVAFSGRESYGTTAGTLVLSQSNGTEGSHILCFDWNTVNAKSTKYTEVSGKNAGFTYDGVYRTDGINRVPYTDTNLYVYYVDKNNSAAFTNDYQIPPAAKGMCTVTTAGTSNSAQKRVYLLFESEYKSVYSFIPVTK